MATENLTPISPDIARAGWRIEGTEGTTNLYAAVDEAPASPTSGNSETIKSNYAQTNYIQFTMSDTVAMGESDSCSQIEVKAWACYVDMAGPLNTRIYINSGWVTSTEGQQTMLDNWDTHRWYTWTFTGTWTKAQVDGMSVEVTAIDPTGIYDLQVSCLYAVVTYETGEPSSVDITVSESLSVSELQP